MKIDSANNNNTTKKMGGIIIPAGMESVCSKKHLTARIEYLLDHDMFKSQELIRLIKYRDKLNDNVEPVDIT